MATRAVIKSTVVFIAKIEIGISMAGGEMDLSFGGFCHVQFT